MRVRVLSAGLAAACLAGCGGQQVTAPRLQEAVALVFARLYDQQQQLVGAGPVRLPRVLTSCARAGSAPGADGPGDDWACALTWTPPGASQAAARYELRVRADGCFTAETAAGAVGPVRLLDRAGQPAVNPLPAFDACLDAI